MEGSRLDVYRAAQCEEIVQTITIFCNIWCEPSSYLLTIQCNNKCFNLDFKLHLNNNLFHSCETVLGVLSQ